MSPAMYSHSDVARGPRLVLCLYLCFLLLACDSASGPSTIAETSEMEVLSPIDGALVYFGDDILFELEVSAAEESIAEISWTSSLDGRIGEGMRLHRSDLTVGHHEISATVVFLDESILTRDCGLVILPRNQNAVVSIVLPDPDSLWYYATDTRAFEAVAQDSSSRVLPVRSYSWTSDRDGIVSQGRRLPVHLLSLGEHDLSLTVGFEDGSSTSVARAGIEILLDPYGETDLLNDREMWTQEDPDAPFVRQEWREWVRTASIPLRSLDSEDYSDLTFLDGFVEGKSIIQLGEVAHGIAEQNRIRVRLIKYLHEKHGFDVVAFESGFFECFRTDESIDLLPPRTALFNSLWGFWHTEDLLDLFGYVRGTRSTNAPMHIAGFDVHQTGRVIEERPAFFRDLSVDVDPAFSQVIFDADQALLSLPYAERGTFIDEKYDSLCIVYDRMIELLETHFDNLSETFTETEARAFIEAAVSARQYIEFRYYRNYAGRVFIRDAQMAGSFRFIKEVLYPGSKVIVWAHNAHVLKDPAAAQVVQYPKMMGSWLDDWYGEDLMTIVSLGYRGTINYGPIHQIEISRPEAIEAILYHTRMKSAFLDLADQTRSDGNGWIFQPTFQTYLHSTAGAYDFMYVPRDQFDAVIFIDTLSKASTIQD